MHRTRAASMLRRTQHGPFAFAVLLLASLLTSGPTASAQTAPSAQVDPPVGAAGEPVTLRGAGWPPNAVLVATLYEKEAVGGPGAALTGPIQVGLDGRFSATGQVPRTLQSGGGNRGSLHVVPGAYVILVRHAESGVTASAPFDVGAPSGVALVWGQLTLDLNANGVPDANDPPSPAGAGVWLGPVTGEPPEASADARGRYVLTLVQPETYTLSAYAQAQDAGWTGSSSVAVREGEAVRRDLLLRSAAAAAPAMTRDARYFSQTGYRVDDDAIWSYFRARGGVEVFGYPVSRTFTFLGCPVQVFQRQVAQRCAGRGVQLLNLLDPELFPYTRVNGSTFPTVDPALKDATPNVGSLDYGQRILEFTRANAPDEWNGQPVRFGSTFFGLITAAVAGVDDAGVLGLVNLEVWGAPISRPAADPTNRSFVYQRFQRGIMHYDATTGVTRGILLADYLKQILRASAELPDDLRAQADGSRLYGQYCPGRPTWLCRPEELPATDLTFAFERG